jgi:capsular polysaccharide biosynthesis protein
VPNDTLVLDIAVTDESPARAADIANAVADQFSTVVGALPQVRTRSAGAVDTTVIQVALPPPDPSSPRVARNVAIGLVLGLVLAAIVCLVVERYFPKKQGDGRPPSTDAVAT